MQLIRLMTLIIVFHYPQASILHSMRISNCKLCDIGANTLTETATFAGGCFWGVEHIFLEEYPPSQNKGILKTSVGYTGGKDVARNSTYREVCGGTTNHAEALKIEFDPSIISYRELVGELHSSSSLLHNLI